VSATPCATADVKGLLPRSFRARLTLSYAVLTALLLTIVAAGITALALDMTIHARIAALDEAVATTRRVVQEQWFQSDAVIVQQVVAEAARPGIRIVVHEAQAPGFGPPSFAGEPPAPAPGLPLDGLRPPGLIEQAPGPAPASLSSFFGLRPTLIRLHEGVIFVGADGVDIDRIVATHVAVFGLALLLTVTLSWAIGRWITEQALAPLVTVTRELRRFASGDFTPRVVEGERSELGELIEAYNGAAEQVVAAFSARERTDQHLRLLLGEAGHEMRTPLTVISAYLDVLDFAAADDTAIRERALRMVRSETRRLRELVEHVMALARLEGNEPQDAVLIDVVEVVRDAVEHSAAARGGSVRLTALADDVVVRGQPWEVQEAVGNLVDNALKYGGGTPVEVAVDASPENAFIRVSDGGPGIGPSDRERIFGHFFRGEAAAGTPGSGLGLAIVARAAERLGGAVALESPGPPHRTTFLLTLPAYQARPDRRKPVRLG
jgi:signal transduction histidine kinase